MRVVAIDGPAGSGKSTVARAVARRLQLPYLDTGAMYRSVAFAVLRAGIDPRDAESVGEVARSIELQVGEQVVVDGVDATEEIRGVEVTAAVSMVAANPAVRNEMVARQRTWVAAHGGGVVEGRDIGTVVFPDAALKVFLTADEVVRASRRRHEAAELGVDGGALAEQVARRDHLDSTRAVSPLRPADDAVVIDTSGMSIDDVVEEVVRRL